MSGAGRHKRKIFISCASGEFGVLRGRLRSYLTAADCDVRTQEDFKQSDVDLIEKLDEYIRDCDAVIHLIGHQTGSVADETARCDFLKNNKEEFLAAKPDLREKLGDCSDLTYTQWEAFLAIHHGVRIRAYHLLGAQPEHRERLKLGLSQRYTSEIEDAADLLGKLIGDLREVIPDLPERTPNNLPASIGSLFKGRDDTLELLRQSLTAGNATAITAPRAIHGLGGLGKTRFAIEYGRRHAADYAALLLVRADSPENLRRNLAELIGPLVLDLPEYTEPDEERRLAAALGWLETHPRWYLILDNVDTEPAAAEVESLLGRLTAGHVVITSRLGRWSAGVETLDLSVLDEADAVDFLLERTAARRPAAATDEDDVRTLAQKLDGLALALEQAGAYIAERRLTFAKYLAHWETRRQKVLAWHDERTMNYPASVAVTWQTTFDQLGPEARRLLAVLSRLAPDPLPRGLIEEGDGDGDMGDLQDAFVELENYSLVTLLDEPPDTFSIHRLVQEIVREREGFDLSDSKAASAPLWLEAAKFLALWAPGSGQDFATWDDWALLEPHLEIVFEKSAAHCDPGPDPAPVPYLLLGFGGYLQCRNGDYTAPEPLFRRAMDGCTRDLGTDDAVTLTSEMWLGFLLEAKGDYEQAEPLFRRAMEGNERVLGEAHPETLNSVNNLAGLLESKGDYDQAEPLYRRALEGRERELGEAHPSTLTCVNNLAGLLQSKGDYAQAEPLFRRALEGCERELGKAHPDTLRSVNNLAELLRANGDLEQAEPLVRRGLEGRERALGEAHPSTLNSVNNLAGLLQSKGDLKQAEPLFRRAYEGLFAKLGPEHPLTVTVKKNWEQCRAAMEAAAKKKPWWRRPF